MDEKHETGMSAMLKNIREHWLALKAKGLIGRHEKEKAAFSFML